MTEGKAAGALTHPNIVTVFDVGRIEKAPYIMMELLTGQTLGENLGRSEKLPVDKVIHIAMQLASALNYAHEKAWYTATSSPITSWFHQILKR